MTGYDSFNFDQPPWSFGQASPTFQPFHPDPLAALSSVDVGTAHDPSSASASSWTLDTSSWFPSAPSTSSANPNHAGPSPSAAFLSPLPIPHLSLGPGPASPGQQSLGQLLAASPVLRNGVEQVKQEPAEDVVVFQGGAGEVGGEDDDGEADDEDADGEADQDSLAGLSFDTTMASGSGGPASASGVQGPPPSSSSTAAASIQSSTPFLPPVSLAASPSSQPLPTSLQPSQFLNLNLNNLASAPLSQEAYARLLKQAHSTLFGSGTSLAPSSTFLDSTSSSAVSPDPSLHAPTQFSGLPSSLQPSHHPTFAPLQSLHLNPSRSSTTLAAASSSDSSDSSSGSDDEDAPSSHPFAASSSRILQQQQQQGQAPYNDEFTPATSAHHSDHESKPSPAGYPISHPYPSHSQAGASVPEYNPEDPYISLNLSLSLSRSTALTSGPQVTYKEEEPPELPYDSDDSADGTFGSHGTSKKAHSHSHGTRGRARQRKPSATAASASSSLAFAAPRPGPSGSARASSVTSSASGSGSTSRKRAYASPDAYSTSTGVAGGSIDPLTGYPRRQTEIPAVEDDPSIRPYGCNYCALDRAAGLGMPDEDDDGGGESVSWRTIKELREHSARAHKDRDKDEGSAMEMPFRCALDPCGKTFKSLAGLRFHFQNASANGHFFVTLEKDEETGEERATKKFKQEVKPSGRELACPVERCPKRFKQSAGLAYHLSHTPNHPISEAQLATFEPTLQSKTKWWFRKLGLEFVG
ncbi:hypothetical protein JCM1840_001669 [Sporobolomyces johnsonii]